MCACAPRRRTKTAQGKMRKKRPLIIGITGGIGTGKSTVASMFGSFGAKVLDADKIAHAKMEKGGDAHKKILKEFGKSVLASSGGIERGRLASIVFKDKRLLDKLCAIIHPEVIKYVKKYIGKTSKSQNIPAVIIDAPLLIEAGMDKMVDVLIAVNASIKTQMERFGKKLPLRRADIRRRMRNQMPLKDKLALADYIIDNEGSKRNTRKIVSKIWKEIKSGRD